MTTNAQPVQPFYPIPFHTMRPAGLIPAHTPPFEPMDSYDEAAEALPLDASDVQDIGVHVGDWVCVSRPYHLDFYGKVETVDEAADMVTVWSPKRCAGGTFEAEYVTVVLTAAALEAEAASA